MSRAEREAEQQRLIREYLNQHGRPTRIQARIVPVRG